MFKNTGYIAYIASFKNHMFLLLFVMCEKY